MFDSMANFALAVPIASIAAISSSRKTDGPRETCQPTISMLSFERKTARAASGSTQMLYSAAGVTLPSQQGAPPITTHRPTRSASLGSRLSASAILVSGPSVTKVRPGCSNEDGNIGVADLRGEQRVLGRLLEANVAGDRRQAEHADIGIGKRHD